MKLTEIHKDYLFRVSIYGLLLLAFYLCIWWKEGGHPFLPISWKTIAFRTMVTAILVSLSLVLLLVWAAFSASCQAFMDHWRGKRAIDMFFKFLAFLGNLPRGIIAVTGTVPVFMTAKFCHFLVPNLLGAVITMLIGSLLLLQLYPHFLDEIRQEAQSGHLWAAMSRGVAPGESLMKKILLSGLDVSRSAFVFLVGLSIFVEYEFRGQGSVFKGLAWELWDWLVNKGENWNAVFQVTVAVVFLVFLMDMLWTYLKSRFDRRT